MTRKGGLGTADPVVAEAVARALGNELRQTREARGLSRATFCRRLPSGIGDRTLHAYEHGFRSLMVWRLLELCEGLEVSPDELLGRALQKAKLYLTIHVDLDKVIADGRTRFRPLVPWARNRRHDTDDGVVHLTPAAVRELAAVLGQPVDELARYLADHGPDITSGSVAPCRRPTPQQRREV